MAMRIVFFVLHVLTLMFSCMASSPQTFLQYAAKAPWDRPEVAVHRLLQSNSSNETANETGEPPSVSVEALEHAATSFLPSAIAGLVVAVLLVIKTVHDNVQSAFANLPEAALILFFTLLGLFSWMVCDMYLGVTTQRLLLDEIGEWLTLMGLFAESMLLITPLILCVPAQEAAAEVAKAFYGPASTNFAQKLFAKKSVKVAMMWLYVMLAIFQISAVYSVFLIAEMKEEAMKQNMAIGLSDFQDSVGPYMICVLYLVLAYCNIATVYEYIFDVSFQQDFPKKMCQRLRGMDPVADSTADQSTTDQPNDSSAIQQLTEHIAAIKELKALPGAFNGLKVSFEDQTQKLLASIGQIFPTENNWKLKLHWALYQVSLFGILIFVGVLDFRVLATVGISAATLVFGTLVVLLLLFVLVFGFFGTLGAMGKRAGEKMSASPQPTSAAPSPPPVLPPASAPVLPPASASDSKTEHDILAKFGNILDAVVLCTTGWTHYAALVFKSGSLPQKQTIEDATIKEISGWIEARVMERDGRTFSSAVQIFIMDGACFTNITNSVLANLQRTEVMRQIFSKNLESAQMLPVVSLAEVQKLMATDDCLAPCKPNDSDNNFQI